MLFNLEYDHGNIISGYLIPDGFSDETSVLITLDDGTTVTLPCNESRPAVVQSGRHETGLVAFRIDTDVIPDLEEQRYLSLHDAKTGLLVYRRPPVDNPVPLKLLRLEMKMQPALRFDAYCGNHFQYMISAVERFGHETTLQAFHLNAIPSIFISGRLLFRNYENFLDSGFTAIAEIPDPYYEMASRLFILQRMAKTPMPFIGDRDRILLTPAAEHFAEVNLQDDKALKLALKKAPDKVRGALSSPVTRQLVCTYPEQRISRQDVASALSALSRFTIIGYGDDHVHYQQAVGELLGLPPMSIPVTPRHSVLEGIAMRLRQIPIAELMLEEDLIFDHYVRDAVAQNA